MDVFDLVAKISLNTSEYEDGLNDASEKTSSFGSKLKSGLGAVAKVGGAAITAASAAIVKFGTDSVNTGKEFDSSMSQVAATLGITTDDIKNNVNGAGDTFDALRAKAQEMGAATNFTATEAAEGLNILAMSGYSANDSIAMIEDVLHLSAAGAMDMASAAGYVAGTMKGFADETKTSGYYADLMAKGATLANTSVQQLGEAMSSGAAGAAAYNQSADSMTVALLRLAEQGDVGSAAGTALSAAMKNLYTPTDQAAAALKELGVAAYDSNGSARDFNTVVNELDEALSGYTEEQRNAYKQTIFGIQGLNAYNKMVVTGTDKQNEWADALAKASDGAGEASKQYGTMTDNLQGDLDILGSAMDGLKIVVSDRLTPSIREFVQFGSDGLARLTAAFQNEGLTGAANELGNIVSDGVSKISEHLPELLEAGKSLVTSLIAGVAQALPDIINMLPDMIDTFLDLILSLVDAIVLELPNIITAIGEALPNVIRTLANYLPQIIDAVLSGLPDIIIAICEALPDIVTAIIEILPQLIVSIAEAVFENFPTILAAVVKGLATIIVKLTEWFFNLIDDLANWLADIGEDIGEWFGEKIEAIGKFFSDIWNDISEWFTGFINDVVQWLLDITTDLANWRDEKLQAISDFFTNIWNDISNWFTGLINDVVQWLVNITTDLANWRDEKLQAISAFFNNIWTSISKWFNGLINDVSTWITNIWTNISEWFSSVFTGVGTALSNTFNSVKEWFSGLLTNIGTWLGNIWTNISNKISTAWEFGKNLVTGLWNGISDTAEWLWNKISGWIGGIWDGIKSFFGIHSPSTLLEFAGNMLGEGMASGIEESASEAIDSALDMAKGINDSIAGNLVTDYNVGVQDAFQSKGVSAVMAQDTITARLMQTLLDILNTYLPVIGEEKGVYIDGDALVGSISSRMYTALDTISVKKSRGVL